MTDTKKTNFLSWILIALFVVAIIFIGLWLLMRYWHELPSTAAEFGDSFGMINALFSALAFAFLIVTALLQRKELEMQRIELSKSSLAQNETQKALNIQVRIMAKQAMLASYQSLFEANSETQKNNLITPNERLNASKAAQSNLLCIKELVKDLEKEKELFLE